MQMQNLARQYPGTELLKKLPDREDWKVPIKVKGATLWIKVMLGDGFPVISPHVQVMSNVSHPAI